MKYIPSAFIIVPSFLSFNLGDCKEKSEIDIIQCVNQIAIFFISLWGGLDFMKYWWSMTLLLPRHGQFSYLTETFIRSQYYGIQNQSHSEVKMKDIENISFFWGQIIPVIHSVQFAILGLPLFGRKKIGAHRRWVLNSKWLIWYF